MAFTTKVSQGLWDGCHILVPSGYIPFKFDIEWLPPMAFMAAQDCRKAVWESDGFSFQSSSVGLIMGLLNEVSRRLNLRLLDKRKARDCLTVCLQSVVYCHKKGLRADQESVYQLLYFRSELNNELQDVATSVKDLQLARDLIPGKPEAWPALLKICMASEQWQLAFKETIAFLSNRTIPWDNQHRMFGGAVVCLVRSLSRLSDSALKEIPKGTLSLYWISERKLWEGIVMGFYEKEEYEGLGIITVGMCDNLVRIPPIPNIPAMRAASIPGLKFSGINIGKILFKLNAKGIKKWHLKMGEFLIQRDADIRTIATEFKKPLLVAMVMLSLHADTPSFLEMAWDRLNEEQLDEVDSNKETAYYYLAKQMARGANRLLANTAVILCGRLLSNGCLPCGRSFSSIQPHHLLPENSRLHSMIVQAVLEPHDGLYKRIERLTTLADQMKGEMKLKSAVAHYETVIALQRLYLGSFQEQAGKPLLKLAIAYHKMGDFDKCHNAAMRCYDIEMDFAEVSFKTLYWLAMSNEKRGQFNIAFENYIEGCTCQATKQDKALMLREGLKLLPRITDNTLQVSAMVYPEIWDEPSNWELVMEAINQKKLWATLKILYLGPPYKKGEGQKGVMWDKPANQVDLIDLWDFLDDDTIQAPRLLLALVQRGAKCDKLSSAPKEGLHAAVRFCALTNDTAVVRYILANQTSQGVSVNGTDGSKRTPLHTLCQLRNKKISNETLLKLAKMLCDAGCNLSLLDCDSKKAVEYATGVLKDWLKSGQAAAAAAAAQAKTSTMTAPPSSTQVHWRTLKESGNKEYSNEKYGIALDLYIEALKNIADKGKNKASSRDRAVIHGNITECFMKMGKWNDAGLWGNRSKLEDPSWFKSYWRLGRIAQMLEEKGYHFTMDGGSAVELYAKALEKIEDDEHTEKNRTTVLSDLLSLELTMADILNLTTIVNVDSLFTMVYHCIVKERDWDKGVLAHNLIGLLGGPTKKFAYDLGFLCQKDKLKQHCKMILDCVFQFYKAGSDITTLKFHPEDYFINALITIAVNFPADMDTEEQAIHIFVTLLTETQRLWKARQKACDDKGNTPLHHVAATKGNHRVRLCVTEVLCRNRFDVFQLNKDKQRAIDLCSEDDVVWKVLNSFSESLTKSASSKASGGTKKEKQKQYLECDACESLMKTANDLLSQRKYPLMYLNLVTVINEKKHNSDPRHGQFRKTCVARIADNLAANGVHEIPSQLTQLYKDGLIEVTKALLERKKWTQVQLLISSVKSSNSNIKLDFLHDNLPIKDVISNRKLCSEEKDRCKMAQFLLENGAKLEPEWSCEMLKKAMHDSDFKIVLMLLNNGADPKGVTLNQDDTPLHAALWIALFKEPDNFSVFDWLTSPDRKVKVDWNVRDKIGNNLLHLAAQAAYSHSSMMAVERLCNNRVPVTAKNKDGKLPRDLLLSLSDRRAEFLRPKTNQAAKNGKSSQAKSHTSRVAAETSRADSAKCESSPSPDNRPEKPKVPAEKVFSAKQCRKEMKVILTNLPDMIIDLFPTMHSDLESNEGSDNDEEEEDEDEEEEEESDREGEGSLPNLDVIWTEEECDAQGLVESFDKDGCEINPDSFDDFPWEIECTEEVWNILKNQRNLFKSQKKRKEFISDSLKKEIVWKIQQLSQGDWTLAKPIDVDEETGRLYRVDLSKGFILLEVAVAFSSKLKDAAGSKTDSVPVYSEIIRLWNIVTSKLEAQQTLRKIILSHRRGKECFVKESLYSEVYDSQICESDSSPPSTLRYPLHYAASCVTDRTSHPKVSDDEDEEEEEENEKLTLCPPASTGKMEFHILKFYSFSSTLVSAVFSKNDLKVDFPFKVTSLEHKIISLPCTSPVLLLGRSGTGKTTICVYRLWKKFLEYWERERHHGQPLLTREGLAVENGEEGGADSHQPEEERKERERKKTDNATGKANIPVQELVCENAWMEPIHDEEGSDDGYDDREVKEDDDDKRKNKKKDDLGENPSEEDGDGMKCKRGVEYHHLHQVFVTKNQQLCSEVGKTFQRLRNSVHFLSDHSRFDDLPLPNTLQDVEEQAFPLFITSRQLLLLLDASLDGRPFFDRDENLALKVNIPGWGTQEEIFHNIPLEDSSDEEFDDFGERSERGAKDSKGHRRRQVHDFRAGGAIPKRQTDKKRECTYEVFAHEVWTKIAQKKVNEFHPSLVWTEIKSIIKGSYEALQSKAGYLTAEKYREVGQKRAPNFCGDRDDVYAIFKNYLKYKREKRLFDEADLVFNMYTRLREMSFCKWVFDEIYVDELQDFTQAELALLIALSYEPNKMFLTGDTAQSIMHGISFRFRDLKSLFYFAKECQSKKDMGLRAIKPPGGVHPLRYNYRSHSGILSLASSVLDMLTRFFPESYDVLDRDQGLFEGPKPVLIESCSQTDLALLLSGNQRKTSHIEFGAHQAILVSNQQAKEDIPPDLKSAIVLTIYESKGLEFDDILLYNFFKDSQASKVNEWRVVTAFLKELVDKKTKEGKTDELNADILKKPGRPHPLTFNPVQHKILNTELKHLYTALTRARVNVWIFDEDKAKSAPVFEYFRVLSLVKAVGLGDKDKGFGDQLFTKKSTTKEWFAKGDMFMKRKLYEPAAKCFGMAGDEKNQKFARAHLLAQKAVQQKHIPMFLEAAGLFVQCERLHPAASCLLRAKENHLAALALEKNGEMKRAADQYKHIAKFVVASLCYERGGMFDLAIGVLVDCQEFERALDCLHRYHNVIKDCQLENKAVPQVIIDHRPRASHSKKHLLYMLAEDYLAKDDEEMMYSTIDRLEEMEDQFHFLEDKGYSERAARILDKMGRTEEAARLMLQENYFQDGLEYARKGKHLQMEASIHLIMAQIQLSPSEDTMLPSECEDSMMQAPDTLHQCEVNAMRAMDLFKETGDDNGKGQAMLVLGCVNKSKEWLLKAHRTFQKMQPPNVAGQIEAFQEMFALQPFKTFDLRECKKGLTMIRKGTQVMKILKHPNKEEEDRHLSYLTFYGLDLIPGSDTVALNPNHFPSVSKKRLASLPLQNEQLESSGKIIKQKSEIVEEIWSSLFADLTSWAATVEDSLSILATVGCDYKSDSVVSDYMESLCLKVELGSLQQTIKSYFSPEPPGEVQSVLPLLDFLPPANQKIGRFDVKLTLKMLRMVSSSEALKNQISKHLLYKWDNPERVALGKSTDVTKERAKESDWLIQACLFESLFRLDIQVEKKANDLEMEIMRLGKEWAKKSHKYAIFVLTDKVTHQITAVESLGGWFIKSFQILVGSPSKEIQPNPYEAIFKFTKLISVLGHRMQPSIMPAPEHLLFWLEFYVSLTFCFIGKSCQEQDWIFYLPASYFHHFDIINACRSRSCHGSLLTDIVKHKSNFYALAKRVMARQDFIINFLVGHPRFSKFSLMAHISHFCKSEDVKDHMIAERMILLGLVLLLNTENGFVNVENRTRLHRALSFQYIPTEKLPHPLASLMLNIPNISSCSQLRNLMSVFLREHRNESIVCCTWQDKMAPPLHKRTLGQADIGKVSSESTETQDFNTNNSALEDEEEYVEEVEEFEEMDEMEKMEMVRRAEQRQKEQELGMKAAKVIIRFLRRCVLKSQQELEKNPHRKFEERYLFAPYVLSAYRCGICGVDLVKGGEDSREAEGPSQTKEDHEMSDKHQSTVESFKNFKNVYINKVLKDLMDISKFMNEYQVQEDSDIYSEISIDVRKLVSGLSAFHKNLKELMMNRKWSMDIRVTATFGLVQSNFQKNKNMLKRQFEYYQKTQKDDYARQLHAQAMSDGFVDENMDFDPYDRPLPSHRGQGGRGRGRGGRGRGNRNRGRGGGRGGGGYPGRR